MRACSQSLIKPGLKCSELGGEGDLSVVVRARVWGCHAVLGVLVFGEFFKVLVIGGKLEMMRGPETKGMKRIKYY